MQNYKNYTYIIHNICSLNIAYYCIETFYVILNCCNILLKQK